MKILALDTSGLAASVALVDEAKTIAEFTINYKKTHSQTIMPMIETLKNMIELELNTIDYIAIASGPGSFTGLRIGAATAKGLAHGLNKKIIPVPTLDGLSYNIFGTNKIICPIMDARRNEVYSSFYTFESQELKRLTDYLAEPIESIIYKALEFKTSVIFLGDAVQIHKTLLKKELGKYCLIAPPSCNMQRAASIGSLAFDLINKGVVLDYSEFFPFYIRKSQAEREYINKGN